MGDAGFEPGTSAPKVWRATNEPPLLILVLDLHRNYILLRARVGTQITQVRPLCAHIP